MNLDGIVRQKYYLAYILCFTVNSIQQAMSTYSVTHCVTKGRELTFFKCLMCILKE